MGCASSKLVAKELERESQHRNGDCSHHVVSLTSTTYGVLKLDEEGETDPPQRREVEVKHSVGEGAVEMKKTSSSREEPSEIINAWELMEGLEEEVPVVVQSQGSSKSRVLSRGSPDLNARSPLKLLNQSGSPRKVMRFGWGKENEVRVNRGMRPLENGPRNVLKDCYNLKENVKKPSPKLWASIKGSPNGNRCDGSKVDSGERRRSSGPLFDPELVASLEREIYEEREKIKKMASASPTSTSRKARNSHDWDVMLESYQKKCPPGGENAVVIYTTTLRGIRKTFEDCNVVRSVLESQNVWMFERDISMHSGFKEELRGLMPGKKVKVPLVFVKGRLIGGADEMVKLDEEGRLGILLDGIPRAGGICTGCGGIRFVMCMACSGSCKVLGEDGKKSVKCSKCNENGLILCPLCC